MKRKLMTLFAALFIVAGLYAEADLLYYVDFSQGTGRWSASVKPEHYSDMWVWDEEFGYWYAYDAYNQDPEEARLISPGFDFTWYDHLTMGFSHNRWGDGSMKPFSVQGHIVGTDHYETLPVSTWPSTDGEWVIGEVDLSRYAGKNNVRIHFVYTAIPSVEEDAWLISGVYILDEAPSEAGAELVEFVPSDFAGKGTESTGSAVSVTKNGVTVATDKGYGHSLGFRVYAGANFSITSTTDLIIKEISFSFATANGKYYNGGLNEDYTVNAKSWSVASMPSQARMEKIQVTLKDKKQDIRNTSVPVKTKKVFKDGNLLIRRGDKIYTVTGQEVQ